MNSLTNVIDGVQGVWDWVDKLPNVPMTPAAYFILSALSIVIGVWALRGNPTRSY